MNYTLTPHDKPGIQRCTKEGKKKDKISDVFEKTLIVNKIIDVASGGSIKYRRKSVASCMIWLFININIYDAICYLPSIEFSLFLENTFDIIKKINYAPWLGAFS